MRLPNCHFASVCRSRQALSTKTSCSLFASGDSFSLCRVLIGPWLSLVERLVRDEEVASSNLAGPTITQDPWVAPGEVRTSVRLPGAKRR